MKILAINNDFLIQENLQPWKILVDRHPEIQLKIIVPPRNRIIGRPLDYKAIQKNNLDIEIVPAFLWQKPQIQIYKWSYLSQIIRNWEPDIVHLNQEPFNFASLELAIILNNISRKPKLIIRSSLLENTKVSTKIEPVFRWVEKKVLPRVDGVECINSMSLSYIRKRNPKAVSTIIPWSRDPDFFSGGADGGLRENLGLDRFTVGYFGNLTSRKDLPTLFEAVSILKRKGMTIQILIVGNGPEKLRLEVLGKELGFGNDIVWHPPVPPEKIVPFYRCLDAFALCSCTEGHSVEAFGRVLIEAMACGVPVLGSSSGAIPEVVGNGGLIFPEKNSEKLAEIILAVYEKKWPMSGQNPGRDRFLNKFTHQKKAEMLIGFYQEVNQRFRGSRRE